MDEILSGTPESIKALEKITVTLAQKDDGLCSKSDVNIEFDAGAFLRKTCSKIQENLEKFIEDGWTKKTESNPRLYDASKFRLASFKSDSNSVNIQIGITSYKELMGTHHFPNVEELLNESYDLCFKGTPGFSDEFAFMSNCLGVGAIALTKDNFVILMERAKWTGEYPGKIDRPGGHPEPDLVKNSEKGDYKNLDTQDVLDEIFQSPQNELRDEINIPLECQSEPKLLGLIRDMDLGGRCAFDFLITINLTKEDVLKRYQSGQQAEADESTALIFLEISRIESWDIPDSLATRLTHHALGGLRLYHLYMKL